MYYSYHSTSIGRRHAITAAHCVIKYNNGALVEKTTKDITVWFFFLILNKLLVHPSQKHSQVLLGVHKNPDKFKDSGTQKVKLEDILFYPEFEKDKDKAVKTMTWDIIILRLER